MIAALMVAVTAPLAGASWWFDGPGPWSTIEAPTAGTATGPLDIEEWRLPDGFGPPQMLGARGSTAQYLTLIANAGSAAVEIDRVGLDERVIAAQWAPWVDRPGGTVSGDALPPRLFPATIPPDGQIRVTLTLKKPDCAAHASLGGVLIIRSIAAEWHARGKSGTARIALSQEPRLCVGSR